MEGNHMADENLNVAAAFAQLRGEMSTGFAKLEGQLALLVQQGADARTDLDALERRVAALEARRVPLPVMAAVSGAVSAVVATVAFLVQL
jgi:BMFP domain-containing protein YqiC